MLSEQAEGMAGAGESIALHPQTLRTVALPEKFMGKKKARSWTEADEQREVKKRLRQDERLAKHRPEPGAPDIAHPGEKGKYERQLAFIASWFSEMWERMELDDEKLAQRGHEARCELQTLLLNTIGQVLRTALKSSGRPKKWAGEFLAIIGVSTGKQDKKLRRVNTAYVEMKKKLSGKGLTSALSPTYVCGIVQQEFKKAGRYRERLLRLKAGDGADWKRVVKHHGIQKEHLPDFLKGAVDEDWKDMARRQKIPEAYWPSMKLPDFGNAVLTSWWEFIWPLIQKKIDVAKLDSRHKLARANTESGGTLHRKRYASDSQKTARYHLQLLARLGDAGLF